MIKIEKHDELKLKIETENIEFLDDLKDFLGTYVPDYFFMPMYKSGKWDGKKYFFDHINKTIPYGLLYEILEWNKSKKYKISYDKEILNIYSESILFEPIYDLKYKPRYYQDECIIKSLKIKKGIFKCPTASGKSIIIAYIIKTIHENRNNKSLIIVPSIGLVEQFYNDLIEYGIDENLLGKVTANKKEWDTDITISTWQSLQNNHDKLENYQTVFVDEVHKCKAKELQKIMKLSKNADYRFGCTGTLPPNRHDDYLIKSYIGPVIKEYKASELIEKGFLNHCKVKIFEIKHNKRFPKGTQFNEIVDTVFSDENRLQFIKDKVKDLDDNIIILVSKVEKEGQKLYEYLQDIDKEVVFLSGKDKADVREYWRNELEKRNDIIMIATDGIMSTGVNIPSLKYLMLASSRKSKILVLQSIGRTLRKSIDKGTSVVFDLADQVKNLKDHAKSREKFYEIEEFDIEKEYIDISK